MKRKTIMVTAGPTREKLDPVRFISNRSSGLLGYEIAQEARKRGHRVIFIVGPTELPHLKKSEVIFIESAADLLRTMRKHLPNVDYLFMTSAVADFTPDKVITQKIKRKSGMKLSLKATPDILKTVSSPRIKKDKIYVGCCLETSQLLQNAKRKIQSKNLDYIVATPLMKKESPFGENDFSPVILSRDGDKTEFEHISKKKFAKKLLTHILGSSKK